MNEIARCPRCNDAVRLPSESGHWVRCPHCTAEYPIDQVLEQLPPELEIISAPAAFDAEPLVGTGPDATKFVAVDTHSEDQTGALLEPEGQPSSPTISQSGSGVSLVNSRPTVLLNEPKAHVRSPETLRAERRKAVARKQRAFAEQMGFVKVALGGVAGLMIGQLILWWLPLPYRTDPADLAPRLPTPIAFLAPASLRGDVAPLLFEEEDSSDNAPLPAPSTQPSSDDEAQNNNSANASDDESAGLHKLVLGQTDAPKFSLDELKEILSSARNAESTVNPPNDAALTRGWYEPLCELARCVTVADPKEPNVKSFTRATKAFVGKVAAEPRKLQAFARFANSDIDDSAYDRKGILLHGKVTGIEAAGNYYQSSVEVENRSSPIAVISRSDPRTRGVYAVGDKVTILGLVISDPRFYLMGYEGQAQTVVFGGVPLRHK